MNQADRPHEDLSAEIERLRRRCEELEARLAAGPASALDNVYFRQLFENSPHGIVLLDDRDRVLDCNRAFETLFGYRRAEARGRAINALIVPEEDAQEASALSEAALEGELVEAERHRRRKDGSLVEVQVLGYPILDGDRQIGIFGIYSDISSQRRDEETLRLQGAAINSSANAIFITDGGGEIVWVNSAFAQLSGWGEQEALGRRPEILDSGGGDEGLDPDAWRRIPTGRTWQGRVVCSARGRRTYTAEQTVTPIRDPHGRITHFVVVQQDISARIEAENRLHHLSRHDPLTDLPNRYTLVEHLETEIRRALRLGRRLAVMALDLDHFKDINEAYGHPAGDELLQAVAQRLKLQLPVGCTLSRTGGDEFAVVQTDFFELYDANSLARRLIRSFDSPFLVGTRQIYTSASVGIAVFPPGKAEAKQLLKRADLALYRAKEEGRSVYRMHTSGMDRDAKLRTRLSQELYGALDREEFFLEYQPQVELPSGRPVGVEALVRWRHPERGRLMPAEFIHLAESSGLIGPIGEFVLHSACAEAQRWDAAGQLPIAVNVSALQFRNPAFADAVAAVLETTGLEPRRLELELTEGILMRPTPVVDRNFQRLERLGVRFALDDFGKGYSSLAYLRRLRLHKLKIDRSFVLGLENEPSQGVIVSAVTALGQQLGLQVIAEGVETDAQLRVLRSKGCSLMQGDHLCAPVSAEAFRRRLEEGSGRIVQGGAA